MEGPKADFTKIMQKQWQEDQLREEIQRLIDTLKAKEKQIKELEDNLKSANFKIKQMEGEFTAVMAEKEKLLKERSAQLIDKDEVLNNLKREVSSLRIALEKERNKSLIEFLKGKRK